MQDTQSRAQRYSSAIWILVLVCISVVIMALAFGAAYTGIQSARLTAAKASLGQIESVLMLAEKQAEEEGFAPPEGSYQDLLKSYDADSTALTPYEKQVLAIMLDTFGDTREFDFAVTRHEDATGRHLYIYYFPRRGQTDLGDDRYYVMMDGNLYENNT